MLTTVTEVRAAAGTTAERPLARLARAVAQAAPPVRLDFARIALQAMVRAYTDEAERARAGRHARADESRLWRWASGTEGYANALMTLLDGLDASPQVEFDTEPDGLVVIVVGGAPVVPSGPRPGEEFRFEAGIVDAFCVSHDCTDLLPPREPPGRPAGAASEAQQTLATPRHASGYWSFSERHAPTFTTDDGLEFSFDDRADLARRRVACALVVDELRRLADDLAAVRAQGGQIEWSALAVKEFADGSGEYVQLDTGGVYFRLVLPVLAHATELLDIARDWLEANSAGRSYQQTFPHAQQLIAPAMTLLPADVSLQ